MPVTDVDAAWREIRGWLAANAPMTHEAIRPPAGARALSEAEAELGFPLGPDLTAWWTCHDGTAYGAGEVLPAHTPYSVEHMRRSWRLWVRIAEEVWDESARSKPDDRAGDMAFAFPKLMVPVATDGSGDDLTVDLRPGPRHGCVMPYDHEQGALMPPPYTGLGDLLDAVATALRSGTPALWRVPSVVGGRLEWRPTAR